MTKNTELKIIENITPREFIKVVHKDMTKETEISYGTAIELFKEPFNELLILTKE